MPARPKVCIDRVLEANNMTFQPSTVVDTRTRALSIRGKSWIKGSTLKVHFLGGSPGQQATVREQAKWWTDVANLNFEFGDQVDSKIRIAFDQDDGAWSYIGTDCASIPASQPTMNLGFLDGGTAAHEFGHAIGLAHEHQNPDGGIQWNEPVVIAELAKSPNFWNEATARHNVLRKYSMEQVNGTAFDPDSIMLYFFPAEWTLNGIATKANEILSATDMSYIAGAKMYPGRGVAPDAGASLMVDAPTPTSASIGAFGEEDIYRCVIETGGRYIVETQGSTDVVMKLFGPNSQTALIAEDDDSGAGLNARIAANLVPGQYFVQVRHYNKAAGVGQYSIRVRRG